jgi:hypothetical protein
MGSIEQTKILERRLSTRWRGRESNVRATKGRTWKRQIGTIKDQAPRQNGAKKREFARCGRMEPMLATGSIPEDEIVEG